MIETQEQAPVRITEERLAEKLHYAETASVSFAKCGREEVAAIWREDASLLGELQRARKELAALYEKLRDSHAVHTSILRGEIALKREAAIHIAGLPANIADIAIAGREMAKAIERFLWEPLYTGSNKYICRCCHSSAGKPHFPDCEISAALENYRKITEGL